MEWYWWVVVAWPLCGICALVMNIRDNPDMQENIGLREVWPVVLGPLWLGLKSFEWCLRPRER